MTASQKDTIDSFPLVPLSAQGGPKIQKLLLSWSPGTPSQYQPTDSQINEKALGNTFYV